jgi:hypothetical protein
MAAPREATWRNFGRVGAVGWGVTLLHDRPTEIRTRTRPDELSFGLGHKRAVDHDVAGLGDAIAHGDLPLGPTEIKSDVQGIGGIG